MVRKSWKLTGFLVVLLTVIAFVPGFICTALGLKAAAGIAALGAVSGMSGAARGGWRIGLRASGATGIAAALATLSVGRPWAAFLVFLLIGLRLAIAGANGMWPAYVLVPISAGFVLGENPSVSSSLLVDALLIGLVLAGAGVFAVLVTRVAFRERTLPKSAPLSRGRALAFGLVLGILLGIAAAIVVTFSLGHTGAWVILTVSLVVQPYITDGFSKALQRAAGTLLGFVISIVIAQLLPWSAAISTVAAIAAILTVLLLVEQRPYWIFATAITVAVVLLEGSSTSILDTARERLIATAIGAGLALLAMAILQPFARHEAHRAGRTHY